MTARKPPAEDSDIIEGVAVERPEDGKSSSAGTRRRSTKKAASKESPASAREGDRGKTPAPKGAALARMSLVLASLAMVLALAGLGLQFWKSETAEVAQQAEIDGLAARLAVAEAEAAAARDAAAALKAEMTDFAGNLPPDLSENVASLAARQDALESGLAAVESAGPSRFGSDGGVTLALAQSGMNIAAAMISDSISGRDPSRWLATLSELRAAGLVVGDLDVLRSVMSPLPPTHDALVAEARGLMEPLRSDANKGGNDSWWTAATGRLSDFVTLRRQGEVAAQDGASTANNPLIAFERAVTAGRLFDAVEASVALETGLAALGSWQAKARRRLALDDALATFSADMAARLARANVGKAG